MPPVVVLGMHRSGTSATARVLRTLGVWLGSEPNVSRRSEHLPLQHVNEQLLRALGGHWSAPPGPDAFAPGWPDRPELGQWRGPAHEALADLGARDTFAWKDPRTCLTLPWWRALLDRDPVVVFSYRHPLEVARSLAARNDFGEAHALALWARYNVGALEVARGLRTLVVPYTDLVAAPAATIEQVVAALRGWGADVPGRAADAAAAIEPDRRHHAEPDELPADRATAGQRDLWALLRTLRGVHEPLAVAAPALDAASAELLAARAALWRSRGEVHDLTEALGSRRSLARRLFTRNVHELRRRFGRH